MNHQRLFQCGCRCQRAVCQSSDRKEEEEEVEEVVISKEEEVVKMSETDKIIMRLIMIRAAG